MITHCAVSTLVSKSCSIEGIATLSAVKSFAITSTPSPIATSVITVPGARRSSADPPAVALWASAIAADSIYAWRGAGALSRHQLGEQARIVGADPVHAERPQRAHPTGVVDGPREHLYAGRPRCLDEAGA